MSLHAGFGYRGAGSLWDLNKAVLLRYRFETYHRILNEAVEELKSNEFSELFTHNGTDTPAFFPGISFVKDCQIETDLELLFPSTYIPGSAERMMLYRELDSISNNNQLEKFKNSLIDRFGKLPDESTGLLDVVRLRWLAVRMGMEKIV